LKEKQDAVVRRLEVIGEAVRNLPEDFKQSPSRSCLARTDSNEERPHSRILWSRFRHRMGYGYPNPSRVQEANPESTRAIIDIINSREYYVGIIPFR